MLKKLWSMAASFSDNLAWLICMALGFTIVSAMPALGQTADYLVGPGDILYISVWGDESLSGTTTVGPDGTIILPPPIGSVYVSQLTAEEITERLTKKLEEYVKQPLVSVSIRSFQGFVVHIWGQVQRPSFYRIPDGTSLQEVITEAGGFTEHADPSLIVIKRKVDKKVETIEVDFTRFLKQSDVESNPILEVDDVVIVPNIDVNKKMGQLVTIVGEVSQPGSHALDSPLSLLDVLGLAGGVSRNADLRNVVILSKSEEGQLTHHKVDLEAKLSGKENPRLQMPVVSPGEIIFVPDINATTELTFPVNVAGQVAKPGTYPATEGMRLIDAIFAAGGFELEASIDDVVLISEQDGASVVSTLSLRDFFLKGDMDVNPVLHEGDTIVVPMIETAKTVSPVQMAFSPSISISVVGEVSKPGAYQMPAGSNLLAALSLAGGPTKDANWGTVMIIRGIEAEGKKRLIVDLEKVVTEGKLELLPTLSSDDTILVLREKEKTELWTTLIRYARDITALITLYYVVDRSINR